MATINVLSRARVVCSSSFSYVCVCMYVFEERCVFRGVEI